MSSIHDKHPESLCNTQNMKSPDSADCEDEQETQCGIGSCKPESVQPCANLIAFTATYGVFGILLNTMATLLSSQITSLERHFNFNSTVSGLLLSSNEIGYLAIILFLSHFGKHTHIPRLLGVSGIIFGLSAIVTSLSNFIAPAHLPSESDGNISTSYESQYLCDASKINRSSYPPDSLLQESQGSSWALWLIGICMALYGVAKTPRNSLSSLYIDNNVKDKSKSSMYIGAVTSSMIFGPSVALLTGGALAKLPVDLKGTYMAPSDPRWIGAWWLGFIVFGSAGVIMSLPLFCIPRRMPGARKYEIRDKTISDKVKDLPMSVLRVMRKPVYTVSVLSSVLQGFAIGGVMSFGPKYAEYQFNIPAWKTSIILGTLHVVTSSFGTFLGGFVTGRFKLTRQGCIKFVIITHTLALGFNALMLVFGCDKTPIEGLDFHNDSTKVPDCNCDETIFLPVCGEDEVTYSSPCQAGCWNHTGDMYTSCSRLGGLSVKPGICDSGCKFLVPYLVVLGLTGLCGTFSMMPQIMVYIRSVDERDKAMALGIYNFLSALLGWMPAPIVYGKVIDSACKILRHTSSNGYGACSHYDIVDLRYKIFGLEASLKVIALILMVTSFFVCRWEDNKNERSTNKHTIVLVEKAGVQNGPKIGKVGKSTGKQP